MIYTIDQFRLNYEQQNQYKIQIQFFNQSNLFQENFFINIEDINEPPYNLQCYNQTGFCTVFDDDFNQTLKFQIKPRNDFRYEIICTDNGQPPLSVSTWINVLPDHLTLIFVPIYSLIIPVDNKIDKETKDNIVILYSNDGDKTEQRQRQRRQANSPPQDIYFNTFNLTVPENSRDFNIANVYVLDEDNDTYICSVRTYNVPGNEQLFEISNGILRTSLIINNNNYYLDFETIQSYNITVTCYDPIHHFTISKKFHIYVSDVNEAPVELRLTPNILPENSPLGYVVGQFYAIDPDILPLNQTFRYTISTDPTHLFRIENDQLILTRENNVEMCIAQPDVCPHDYEQKSSLYVRINVEDSGQPVASQKYWIHIRITDQNDPPVNLQLNTNFVNENSPMETLIGSFSVQDQDLYQIHTFNLLNEIPSFNQGNFFLIDGIDLRLLNSPDYEQQPFIIITVQAIDNGTIPKSKIRDFRIEITDIDELPTTYIFLSNLDEILLNKTINDLINNKPTNRTNYLPQKSYFENSLGQIIFLMEDRNRNLSLNGIWLTRENEFNFSKPICQIFSEIPYRLSCRSNVTLINSRSIYDTNDGDGHLVSTSLVLTSNGTTMTFPKPLRIKFENIILTINNEPIEGIYILKTNATGYQIGIIHAIDLAAGGQPVQNVTLNSNRSLSYPLEIVNSTLLKIRDDVNFSSVNSSLIFNVSLIVTTTGEDSRIIEKFLFIYIKDKNDFNLTLSNNKIMENSHENILVGNIIIENGIGDYIIELIDNANGQFKLNQSNILTAKKYLEHCHMNHSCPLDHETEPIVNITIAIRDPSTNKILRLVDYLIEIKNENEPPYNLTLSSQSIPENTTIESAVSLINAIDDDFNQTLTYSVDNPIFSVINNQLILKAPLNHNSQQSIPIIIRATDNGTPPEFTEKLFIINVTAVNRPPLYVTSSPMTVYYPGISNSTRVTIGQLCIVDPDVRENFTITFNELRYRAITPATNSYSIISDLDSVVYAQMYNISIEDLNLPIKQDKIDYFINVTTNIIDSDNHSISYEFSVHYVPRPIINTTIQSTIPSTTTSSSLSQLLHVRIYETTPPNTPIIRGLLTSPSSYNNTLPTCIVIDDQIYSFPINTTHSTFTIFLPNNYTLNSTIRPTILLNVQCYITDEINLNQDIVVDVLPAPPTVQINFNQTKPFYAINNDTILGTFSLTELTTIPTNRTFNLSLINYQNIFQLLSNDSLMQINSYPLNLLPINNSYINLTVQAFETTPNEPIRFLQNTFSIPIIINTLKPHVKFSRTSIPYDTNPNTIIGNLTVHNLTTPYRLNLIETYDNGLELDSNTNTIILKRVINTLPLINNQTQLPIKIELMNEINQTILITTFPLIITYTNLCLNRDCVNGTCIQLNETSFYCLCTNGYKGIDCRLNDSCSYNPCTNNGTCQQLSSSNDFICQCLPNYSGRFCEIIIDICQLDTSSCLLTDTCIPNNDNNLTTCISADQLQYFVFDYLKNWQIINILNNNNLTQELKIFIENNLFPIENVILYDRKILGPEIYNRAELLSIGTQSLNTTLNDALQIFCINQSLIIDSFAREICHGYQQAIDLDTYFKSIPDFCPNCSFVDAAQKYYWFDRILPLLPLWIALIVGSVLLTAIPLLPFCSNVPKKVILPLMKARTRPEDVDETNTPLLAKSVRTAVKLSRYSSSRERNDSGYESTEETNTYIEEIIKNYQQEQQEFNVYPILHKSRSPNMERRGTTIDDVMSSSTPQPPSSRSNNNSRYYKQRSASMSGPKIRRQSSVRHSQTLKPIIQRRSTLFDSQIGSLIRLTGTPRLNNDDDTYVSSTFRNENTSKFVIGTLWNTFALVNNLFLQRPRKRRNAISGENIQAEQLAHLQQLYSLAEQDQNNDVPINNLHGIIREILSEPQTNNLRSIIFDILSSNKEQPCKCYGNHHVPSCIYYDHSLPYIKRYLDNTSELEKIFYDVQKSNKPRVHNASTQSYIKKPIRTFQHFKTTTNVATQSSPITTLKPQFHSHVATQYSPIRNQIHDSTQTNKNNNLDQISTQFNSRNIEYTNILPRNTSTQFSPIENENNFLSKKTTTQIGDENIYDRRNSVMNELKHVISSTNSKTQETNVLPNHTVRSLVSMFETTSPPSNKKKSNLLSRQKSINNQVLTPSDRSLLNISTEDIQSSIVHDTIEQYANDIAFNILDNAVLTATTTPVYQDEQLHRRFSFYKNGGGDGKSLLFQTNTFVPLNEMGNEEFEQNLRVESQASSTVFNDRLSTSIPFHPENESQHTLIVGRYIDGIELKRKKHRSSTVDNKFYLQSSSSDDENDNNEQIDQNQQFLSNSELLSAQELYIRPWLVRRATAPDIHCLDNNITDTRVEIIDISSPKAFFNIFPKNNNPSNIHTRFTCLITILFYLHDIHDENSNQILYDEIEQIEKQFINLNNNNNNNSTPLSMIHSNAFQTINPDGSKRYRTGFVLDINSSNTKKIFAQQIEWKCVKIIVRRFRKKYRYYKQFMKIDEKLKTNQLNIENYLKYFDSTSKRRIKKYAKHYANKL